MEKILHELSHAETEKDEGRKEIRMGSCVEVQQRRKRD